MKMLLRIAKRRHDIVGIHVYDPREVILPKVGLIRGIDAETGQTLIIDTNSKKQRAAYEQYFHKNQAYFQGVFLKSGLDTISIEIPKKEELTRNPQFYVKDLLRFFKRRK